MRTTNVIRQSLVSLRDNLDGRLHAGRRAAAVERIRRLEPYSVLFICLGNVCRSPFAERVLRREFPTGLSIDSSGFLLPGRPPPDDALAAAAAIGIDHADHRSKVLGAAELASTDALFLFDRFNVKDVRSTGSARMDRVFWLGDFDPLWTGKRAIIDPWGRTLRDFTETFERIERCIRTVVTCLPHPQAPPEPTDRIPGGRV